VEVGGVDIKVLEPHCCLYPQPRQHIYKLYNFIYIQGKGQKYCWISKNAKDPSDLVVLRSDGRKSLDFTFLFLLIAGSRIGDLFYSFQALARLSRQWYFHCATVPLDLKAAKVCL
jgi:hypothetical protein